MRPGVTVRDLLAHMAGVSGSWGEGTARGEPVPGLLEILAGTAATPPVVLEALPGLTWSYSGGGYLIVAQVICDVTGLVLDDATGSMHSGGLPPQATCPATEPSAAQDADAGAIGVSARGWGSPADGTMDQHAGGRNW